MIDRYTAEMAREGWGFWAVDVSGARRSSAWSGCTG